MNDQLNPLPRQQYRKHCAPPIIRAEMNTARIAGVVDQFDEQAWFPAVFAWSVVVDVQHAHHPAFMTKPAADAPATIVGGSAALKTM